jgi:polyribonucleotide nucleotidyltransferase
LFPEHFFDEVQVLITVYSVDPLYEPTTLSMIAGSLALSISKMPFMGPIGAVQVGRIDGKWIIDPTYEQSEKSDAKIIIAGIEEGICMVEGATNEISEKEFVDVLFMAHDAIKQQVQWQQGIARELNVVKEDEQESPTWAEWRNLSRQFLSEPRISPIWTSDKVKRNEAVAMVQKEFLDAHQDKIAADAVPMKFVEYIFDTVLKQVVCERIFKIGTRVDGRKYDEVRDVSVEVGLLPRTHGSALFNRGSTQALVTATLGSGEDEQRVETLMSGDTTKSFMLHYNFPPFSVGEVKPMRGPGRREIGHGALAASALKAVLPEAEKFPYTIRVVSDILSCDGSSSMATVCGSVLSLMDAGVPIKKVVGGVAMGLLQDPKGGFQAITDITGFEDAFGLMDLKLAGSQEGITAVQMDIKYKGGLPREVFERALEQARQGRVTIMNAMKKVIAAPREKLSDLVPKIVFFKVEKDKIGAIIGPGGKVIREIIEVTGVAIDIEDDGTVKIFGQPGALLDKAVRWVKTIAGNIEPGEIYDGTVQRIADFGVFVELMPGVVGLIHVSAIPREKQRAMQKEYPEGMALRVEVLDYDPSSGRIRLRPADNK